MRQLVDSGAHFGHQTRRWNPKMKRFIFTERNGIYIVDLQQSLTYIDTAYNFVKETVAHGGTILFIGTKKQAQQPVAEQAVRVGMPYVNERWLGGMLTNFQTVNKRLQRLKELELIDFADVAGSSFTKKELLIMRHERDKLAKTLGGMRDMHQLPSVVWIVDTNKEHLAVDEARKLGIPIVAILDTNCDPDVVDYPIPGNDDAIRAISLLTRVIADAAAEGLLKRHAARTGTDAPADADAEQQAEWERELLAGAEAGLAADAAQQAEWEHELLAGGSNRSQPTSHALTKALIDWVDEPIAESTRYNRTRLISMEGLLVPVRSNPAWVRGNTLISLALINDNSPGRDRVKAVAELLGVALQQLSDPDEWTVGTRVVSEAEDDSSAFVRLVRTSDPETYEVQFVAAGEAIDHTFAAAARILFLQNFEKATAWDVATNKEERSDPGSHQIGRP